MAGEVPSERKLTQLALARQSRLDRLAVNRLNAAARQPSQPTLSPKAATDAVTQFASATTTYLALVAQRSDLLKQITQCESEMCVAERLMGTTRERMDLALGTLTGQSEPPADTA